MRRWPFLRFLAANLTQIRHGIGVALALRRWPDPPPAAMMNGESVGESFCVRPELPDITCLSSNKQGSLATLVSTKCSIVSEEPDYCPQLFGATTWLPCESF
jgi:hypothetical protein